MNTPTAKNVLTVFRAGTSDDITAGREWYPRARGAALDIARTLYATDTPTSEQTNAGAAIIAVLSPMMTRNRNVALARQVAVQAASGASHDEIVSTLGCLKRNAVKAASIALGADPAAVVSGPKVVPFWQRIAEAATGATGPGSVVIDRHAHDIALGMVTDDRTRGLSLSRKGGHCTFQMCYVRAAAVLRRTGEAPGITPSELQAVTWIVWRREFAHSQAKAEARREAGE